ncbi:Acyltransferase family protein [Chitinophaga sp. CF118]|uniref:acyltransferase family protein n=1 Tax=Chitinophaga sp. CF118 TaxID=1884367 RepID=UPI0008E270A9|nr:acyltransferase [Chitinophaga sp. CF118]SFD76493.1 Acyltransferase family protein [Chitinophaga sp. CF118]
MQKSRTDYLDHIKVLLTILVILHHAFVCYGAPGGWYYKEPTTNLAALIPMTLFVSINQSFFMGFFFLLSAYFTEPSLLRKGTRVFLQDRLKRFGIPLIFYSLVLSPFMSFLVYRYGKDHPISYFQYLQVYDNWIEFGVLWFVAALLLFTFLFVALKNIKTGTLRLPGTGKILLFAIGLGLISFFVRVVFPVGWVLHPVGFQFGHFPQYITLFIIGIIANRNNWTEQLQYRTARNFGWIALLMIIIGFPVMFYLKTIWHGTGENFSGGWTRESFMYSIWEQVTGFSIIIAMTGIFKHKFNGHSTFLSKLSREAFAVYIFHPLPLVVSSLLLVHWTVAPALKLLVVAPLGVIGAILLGKLLVRIPGVNKII